MKIIKRLFKNLNVFAYEEILNSIKKPESARITCPAQYVF